MPPPTPELDIKRRARHRLIGAVMLILLAVIVLPLLLEDEPPPASSLAVKMAVVPVAETPDAAVEADEPAQDEVTPPEPLVVTPPKPEPEARTAQPPAPKPKAEPQPPKPKANESRPPEPAAKPEVKPVVKVVTPTPAEAVPAASGKAFVVQLAALADAAKAQTLKARAAESGLPTYTDTVGKLTRVRVGPFATHEAATAAAVKLANNGMPGQVVAK
ncbi:MAG: SPOR domain-containing protein [Thiobacillus sp.]|nr:SPOR domain-containing protein [Thiobacillus sp.]